MHQSSALKLDEWYPIEERRMLYATVNADIPKTEEDILSVIDFEKQHNMGGWVSALMILELYWDDITTKAKYNEAKRGQNSPEDTIVILYNDIAIPKETQTVEKTPVLDRNGMPVYDEDGNIKEKVKTTTSITPPVTHQYDPQSGATIRTFIRTRLAGATRVNGNFYTTKQKGTTERATTESLNTKVSSDENAVEKMDTLLDKGDLIEDISIAKEEQKKMAIFKKMGLVPTVNKDGKIKELSKESLKTAEGKKFLQELTFVMNFKVLEDIDANTLDNFLKDHAEEYGLEY
ncbi:MAG: hypothetical protein K6G84_12620 [Lachnospiraceae bacterium]|nr:hypothetical protein [Lachnospiraceae bacterium]